VKDNPLLALLQSEAAYYEVSNCDCGKDTELASYPAALDQIASTNDLAAAGHAGDGNAHVETSLIYLSEALRFEPTRGEERIHRAYDLVDFDESAWAVAEASQLIAASPRSVDAFKVRGHAYEAMNDYTHAEQDFRAALGLAPHDEWTLTQLGDMFVNWTHEWDKGWAISSQLITDQPQNPYGWMLRATIQEHQPRPGLKDTVDYFEARFSNDPQWRKIATAMRSSLILQTHSGSKVLAARDKSAAGKSKAGKSAALAQ
jgi:tetratricopeptide (TPR) repeat protein